MEDIGPHSKRRRVPQDPEEQRAIYAAIDSFRLYRQAAHHNVTHLRRQSFYSLPNAHIDLLSSPPFELPQLFRRVDDAIDSNADIAEAICRHAAEIMNIDLDDEDWKGKATPNDLDKARSTIRQLYRDWSHEGAEERDACYNPIFGALADYFGEHPLPRRHIRVLVPGSGLSRLPLELFKAGYTVVANEVSHHQTMAADYIMNGKLKPHHHDLYPFALSFSNHRTRGDQLTKVSIPDLDVHTVLNGWPDPHARPTRSTVGGDFCVAFRAPRFQERYEAVVTCFFIDTAPNLIYYVDTMKHCLRTSGIWVNIGPLLWHAESRIGENETVGSERQSSTTAEAHLDIPERIGINEPGTFELSDDEVKQLVTESGFEIIEARQTDPVGYIQNSGSMLQHIYQPSFWVARKLDEKAE